MTNKESANATAAMAITTNGTQQMMEDPLTILMRETEHMSINDIEQRARLIEQEMYVLKQNEKVLKEELRRMMEETNANEEKIRLNRQLPYLVSTIVEIFNTNSCTGLCAEDAEAEDAALGMLHADAKSAVIKTSTRQTVFLPVIGLVDASKLKPGDLVGVNRDSFLILDTLPAEYDARVKAMEVDEKPRDSYTDVGGLEKQVRELIEAISLPITHKALFHAIGIQPSKGVLMYGPPGTGKTMMARACAAQTNACFLKLAGSQLVQMYIGDGAKIVRDAFALAKEKAPTIIFIDEIDAIGSRRSEGGDQHGSREVQRTLLELLSQLDGFQSHEDIKVIAATNRIDVLDPALLRSGRLDRKIEFPLPEQQAREHILRIHSKKMNLESDIHFQELARSTEDMNGAQLKAVCLEAGMLALRRNGTIVSHEDFLEGIHVVFAKKKINLNYYA